MDFRDHDGHRALLLMASRSAFPWKTRFDNADDRNTAEIDVLHFFPNIEQDATEVANPQRSCIDANGYAWTTQEASHDINMPVTYDLRTELRSEGHLQSGKHYKRSGPGFAYYAAHDLPNNAEWTIPERERRNRQHFQVQVRMRLEINDTMTRRWEAIKPLLDGMIVARSETRLRELLGRSINGDLVIPRARNIDFSTSTTVSGGFSNLTATLRGHRGDMTSGLLLFLLPALYGAIHLSAWTFEFPTAIEHKLWKIACLDLVVSLPVFLIGSLAREVGTNGEQFTMGDMAILAWLGLIFLLVNMPVTIIARMYLVVESFVSLRRVPVGVYATVPWSDWLPHI